MENKHLKYGNKQLGFLLNAYKSLESTPCLPLRSYMSDLCQLKASSSEIDLSSTWSNKDYTCQFCHIPWHAGKYSIKLSPAVKPGKKVRRILQKQNEDKHCSSIEKKLAERVHFGNKAILQCHVCHKSTLISREKMSQNIHKTKKDEGVVEVKKKKKKKKKKMKENENGNKAKVENKTVNKIKVKRDEFAGLNKDIVKDVQKILVKIPNNKTKKKRPKKKRTDKISHSKPADSSDLETTSAKLHSEDEDEETKRKIFFNQLKPNPQISTNLYANTNKKKAKSQRTKRLKQLLNKEKVKADNKATPLKKFLNFLQK